MPNENCLEGKRCPKCGQEDELLVSASLWVSVRDNGTDAYADSTADRGDTEYDDDSPAACPECEFEGKWRDFTIAWLLAFVFPLLLGCQAPERSVACKPAQAAVVPGKLHRIPDHRVNPWLTREQQEQLYKE